MAAYFMEKWAIFSPFWVKPCAEKWRRGVIVESMYQFRGQAHCWASFVVGLRGAIAVWREIDILPIFGGRGFLTIHSNRPWQASVLPFHS